MPRDYRVFLDDILESINKISNYISGFTLQDFACDSKTFDAVIRNLEIIGEAIKKIPEKVRLQNPDVEWKKIGDLRNILIHEYFGVDIDIIWDVIQNKLPQLKQQIKRIAAE